MSWGINPRVELTSDGIHIRLIDPLEFEDSKGVNWVAPPGMESDGASIPWLAQMFIGSPLVGKYRRAAIMHDHYCVTKTRSSYRVHWAFFEGMLADDVRLTKAIAMWMAVATFGPKFLVKKEKT
jgi:hypothetical protein|tara:strand:- start:3940 stop:4311 length:372 start_codon:yes stop_codon:yes gene_type:complete